VFRVRARGFDGIDAAMKPGLLAERALFSTTFFAFILK